MSEQDGTDRGDAQAAPPSVFRFAPSPNGRLHLGHAYSALLNDRLARGARGRFLLRFEDIDRDRCRADYEAGIETDLRWLGLAWEEPVRRQSARFPVYRAALEGLVACGLAYPCFCTRATIRAAVAGRRGWAADPDGAAHYPGTCRSTSEIERIRRLASGERRQWRLDMAAARIATGDLGSWRAEGETGTAEHVLAEPERWGDAVIARNEPPASYHLAVVIDDADQGVTDVVRGEDMRAATDLHVLLQHLLGLPSPRYRHHRLIAGLDGRKLSKSRDAPSLRALREAGIKADRVRRDLGF